MRKKTRTRLLAGVTAICCVLPQMRAEAAESLAGDVNADGTVSVADAVSLVRFLTHEAETIGSPQNADMNGDAKLNVSDLTLLKRLLLGKKQSVRSVYVTNTEELKAALADAQAGDEIVLAEGTYVYSGSTAKGYMFQSGGEGTEEAPIRIHSENPEKPAVLSGSDIEHNFVFSIFGDWWIVEDLVLTTAQKGMILDNSNYSIIRNVEVCNLGSEGIHFRDDSSYCLAENCYVHDTGLISPGYGEAIYIGSAKNTTEYGHDCHYNTVRGCKLGPNVAAEHIDVKEYTIGTLIEDCIFDGKGMSGENYADSFVDIKGNDCVLRNCVGYRNGCEKINRAFESNQVVDGWGQNAFVYGNKAYMDTPTNAGGKKMYFLNCWDCTVTAWDNFIAYEDETLKSVDDPADKWSYYNCNMITYGDASYEEKLP